MTTRGILTVGRIKAARCIALGLSMTSVPIRTIYDGAPSHIRPVHHLREFARVTRKARRIARGG